MGTKKTTPGASGPAEYPPGPRSILRAIYCDSCTRRALADGGPCRRCVRGVALDFFSCDRCNRPLPPGGECFAVSLYDRPADYRPWEHDYVENGQVVTAREEDTATNKK